MRVIYRPVHNLQKSQCIPASTRCLAHDSSIRIVRRIRHGSESGFSSMALHLSVVEKLPLGGRYKKGEGARTASPEAVFRARELPCLWFAFVAVFSTCSRRADQAVGDRRPKIAAMGV